MRERVGGKEREGEREKEERDREESLPGGREREREGACVAWTRTRLSPDPPVIAAL